MFVRTFRKSAVIRAIVYGALCGVVGVGVFVMLLKFPTVTTEGELLPIDVQQEEEVLQQETFYARQFGVFSTQEGAVSFLSTAPLLNKAAIVRVDEQHFVWGNVSRGKQENAAPTIPASFYKSFMLASSCPQAGLAQLPALLHDEKWLNNSFEEGEEMVTLPEDWVTLIPEVMKLSDDLDVVRLHVLNHYYEQLDCLKITF